MATAPVITFRDFVSPYGVLSAAAYVQSTLGGNNLPVLQGEVSNVYKFRVYNNFALAAGIASAVNVSITVYDNNFKTATQSPASQSWVRVYETGFGESKGTPGVLTEFLGTDTAIGGSPAGKDKYTPEIGSAGTSTPQIRAGTDTNGLGFIEVASYVETPEAVGFFTWTFSISVLNEWSP